MCYRPAPCSLQVGGLAFLPHSHSGGSLGTPVPPAVAITSHQSDTRSQGCGRSNQVGTVSRPNRLLMPSPCSTTPTTNLPNLCGTLAPTPSAHLKGEGAQQAGVCRLNEVLGCPRGAAAPHRLYNRLTVNLSETDPCCTRFEGTLACMDNKIAAYVCTIIVAVLAVADWFVKII
jgi:hypothetical protein